MADRKRTLVVDDNEDIRTSLGEALSLAGYEVEVADDAAQAWEVARRIRPDVIVMDSDGLDVIERIKAENPGVFAVVFSGWSRIEAQARAAGADAFVLKPDFEGLMRILAARPW